MDHRKVATSRGKVERLGSVKRDMMPCDMFFGAFHTSAHRGISCISGRIHYCHPQSSQRQQRPGSRSNTKCTAVLWHVGGIPQYGPFLASATCHVEQATGFLSCSRARPCMAARSRGTEPSFRRAFQKRGCDRSVRISRAVTLCPYWLRMCSQLSLHSCNSTNCYFRAKRSAENLLSAPP